MQKFPLAFMAIMTLLHWYSYGTTQENTTKSKTTVPVATKPTIEEQQLLIQLEKLNIFETQFVQTTFNKDGKKIQEVKGIMKSKRPAKFYWQAFQPYPQVLVTDGKTIWQYDADLEQVTLKDYQSQLQQANLVKVFEAPQKLLENFRLTGESHGKNSTNYYLTAKQAEVAVKSLVFTFAGDKLTDIEFTDALGQKTHMHFDRLTHKKTMADKVFTFTIPKSADVIDDRPHHLQKIR
ncbi:MAG: outer membrane lipoprotein chaperone LolA [Cellvibrionales bacterium]|nr:outer membrane lipoprotein chaperone LolA [Cellvibrionales bacterium]